MTPLDDELSDLRYAPREILIRAIRSMASILQDSSTLTVKEILAEVGLMDGKAPPSDSILNLRWCGVDKRTVGIMDGEAENEDAT